MCTQELYNEAHRLFSYDAESGFLTRRIPALNRHGTQHHNSKCKVGDITGSVNADGYLHVRISGKQYRAHRIIWLMVTGSLPVKFLDHKNGNRADNRLCNLREANLSENSCNQVVGFNNKSGFKGVFYAGQNRKKPYRVQIKLKGKQIHIGYFPTTELAHEAYYKASKELHGEFSVFERESNPFV